MVKRVDQRSKAHLRFDLAKSHCVSSCIILCVALYPIMNSKWSLRHVRSRCIISYYCKIRAPLYCITTIILYYITLYYYHNLKQSCGIVSCLLYNIISLRIAHYIILYYYLLEKDLVASRCDYFSSCYAAPQALNESCCIAFTAVSYNVVIQSRLSILSYLKQ